MTLHEIKLLHAFNAWANNRIFEALENLPPAEFTRDLKSSHGSIHGTLAHMVAAEKIWLSRFAGTPDKDLMPASAMPALADVKAAWESTGYAMAKFLGSMTDRKLQETFTTTYASGKTYTYIYWQAFQHVVDHSSYHRGQIITLMRQLGHTPPSTGLIGFYRETVKIS
jgi:uncharacterized damage-inducible protein DinB